MEDRRRRGLILLLLPFTIALPLAASGHPWIDWAVLIVFIISYVAARGCFHYAIWISRDIVLRRLADRVNSQLPNPIQETNEPNDTSGNFLSQNAIRQAFDYLKLARSRRSIAAWVWLSCFLVVLTILRNSEQSVAGSLWWLFVTTGLVLFAYPGPQLERKQDSAMEDVRRFSFTYDKPKN